MDLFYLCKKKKSKVLEDWLDRIENLGHRLQDISWGDIGDMLTDIVKDKSLYYFVQNKKHFVQSIIKITIRYGRFRFKGFIWRFIYGTGCGNNMK